MDEQKTIVVSIRMTPATMAALKERAAEERQPARRMATLLIEDALSMPAARMKALREADR